MNAWDNRRSVMWNDGPELENFLIADDAPAVARRNICNGGGKGGGGGTSYQTTQMQIPKEVMARYNAVNARAEEVANKPFQPYYGEMTAPMMGSQQQALQGFVDAQGAYIPYFDAASSSLSSGTNAAMPYYDAATGTLSAGLSQGQALGQQSLGTLGAAQSAANPLNSAAANNITNAQGQSSPYNTIAANSLLQAANSAAPLQGQAVNQYGQALTQSSPYNTNATNLINGGLAGSQPYNAQAGEGYQNALSTGQGYLDGATAYTLAGGNSVNPEQFNQGQIDKYMSPYLSKVMDPTMALLQQQQGREQSNLMGSQMARGAFGGDRAGIGAANLAQQQNLATALTAGNLLNQGYGQALNTFQQQQGVNLGAEQANRAATQQTGQTLAGLGQQGYSQQMGVAQGQQSLGNQVYSQGLGAGQAIAGVGNQIYNQQMGAGNANAQLAAQLYGQGANTSAQQAAIGNQIFSQGLGAANAQGQLANNVFGQGLAASQQQANVGNMMFNQGLGASQQQAALGQGLYGMGANNAQIQAGMGSAAQQNALAGASGLMGAGTVEQQTRQAYDTANYNQFLQQQGYDFQTAQFLANIAMGTGALSGSTSNTVSTQPGSFFSDERLKENMREVGRTHDGQPIFAYNFPGEPTQIGLSAQKVERKHPEAVGESQGYKTVNYDIATQRAAKADGGAVPPEHLLMSSEEISKNPQGWDTVRPGVNGIEYFRKNPDYGDYKTREAEQHLAYLNDLTSRNSPWVLNSNRVGRGREEPDSVSMAIARAISEATIGQPYGVLVPPRESDFADAHRRIDASRAHKAGGGLAGAAPYGGVPGSLDEIIAMQRGMFGGGPGAAQAAAAARVPVSAMSAPQQAFVARHPDMKQDRGRSGLGSLASSINEGVGLGKGLGSVYSAGKEAIVGSPGTKENPTGSGGLLGSGGKWNPSDGWVGKTTSGGLSPSPAITSQPLPAPVADVSPALDPTRVSTADMFADGIAPIFAARGGRAGYATGGLPYGNGVGYIPEDAIKVTDPDELKNKQKGMGPDSPGMGGSRGQQGGGAGKAIGSAVGGIAGSFFGPVGTMAGSTLGGLFGGLFNEGGRVGYETGGAPDDEQGNFLKMMTPHALEVSKQTGLDPRLVLAQSALETGYGKSAPGNNYFGIKSHGAPGGQDLATTEVGPNGEYKTRDTFRTYGDPSESARDYAAFVTGNSRYQPVLNAQGLDAQIDAMGKSGYATDPDYASKLRRIAAGINVDPSASAPPTGLAPMPMFQQASNSAPAKDRDFLDRAGDWLGRNERPIVSLLSGLGAMAASPSRYAGSAILEGLGAGAQTYANMGMKQQALDTQKQQANTGAQRVGIEERAQYMTVLNQLKAMQAAQVKAYGKSAPELDAQIANVTRMISGAGGVAAAPPGLAGAAPTPVSASVTAASPAASPSPGIPYKVAAGPVKTETLPPPSGTPGAPGAPANPPPAAPPPQAPTKPRPPSEDDGKIVTVRAEGMPEPPKATPEFLASLDPEYNPDLLLKKAQSMYAYDSALAKQTEDQARAEQQKILERGYGVGPGGTQVPLPGWDNFNAMRANIPANQEWMNKQDDLATRRAAARQNVNMIRDIVETYQTGQGAEALAKMSALARSIGLEAPTSATMDPAAFQKFTKDAYNNILQSGAVGGTDALRGQVQNAFAGPMLQPEANKAIIAQTLGQLDYEDKLAQSTIDAISKNKGLDRTTFGNEFRKSNDPEKYRADAYKNLAVRGATPKDPAQLKEDHVYVIEPSDASRFGVKIDKPTKYKVVTREGVRGLQRVD